ncbi:hypothetical protein [Actinomadura sp. B10D3]|uniref:hypothetical protein n=1 Tax=Actinomadura sp. B10D3 TaxID=3153557 RepID=UPI00325C6211
MALRRRTKLLVMAAGLAGAGTVAAGGAAMADPGPEPVRTRFQIVEYQAHGTAGAPGTDCPDKTTRSVAEGTK